MEPTENEPSSEEKKSQEQRNIQRSCSQGTCLQHGISEEGTMVAPCCRRRQELLEEVVANPQGLWPPESMAWASNSADVMLGASHSASMDDAINIEVEEQDTPEPRTTLPEGDFVDGKLGLVDDHQIEELVEQLGATRLFEDRDFPADSSMLASPLSGVEWKRPHELVDDPHLYVDGVSRKDVKQGKLGDCWFLSACAAIATTPALVLRVISPNQPLSGRGYRGVVKVNLWRFGEWVRVYVDDRLPTSRGELLFGKCVDPREFWVSIVEKAMAKLFGGYKGIDGGTPLEAFVDLTGGIAEKHVIPGVSFKTLVVSFKHGAHATAGRFGDLSLAWQAEAKTGLVKGHAYTLLDARCVPTHGGQMINLVHIRNPWAEQEWKGAWSDRDPRWDTVDEQTKKSLKFVIKDEGEFWMDFRDFEQQFQQVTICTLGPSFNADGLSDPSKGSVLYDKWVAGENAGGSSVNIRSYATNPQYLVKIKETDDSGYTNNILIGLMQEHRRSDRYTEMKKVSIAFFIYKMESEAAHKMDANFFARTKMEGCSGPYKNSREVVGRFDLIPGYYLLLPATFRPGKSLAFMIRIFSLGRIEIKKLQ